MAHRPITEDERHQVRDLHAAGLGRNEIATQLGRSAGVITKIAGQLNLSFDRSATRAATAAKEADARAKRSDLMNKLLDDAERLRQQLFAPTVIHNFGGKDNTYNSKKVEQPPFRDQRDIVLAVSTTVNTSLRLDLHDGDASIEQVGSLLGGLFDSLRGRHPEDEPPPADDGDA